VSVRTLCWGMEANVLLKAYEAFNARDIEAVLALMCEDVNLENALTRDRVIGKAKVRDLWLLQWKHGNPKLEPLKVYEEDGKMVILSRHTATDADGRMMTDQEIEEVYTIRDGLVARMDFRQPKAAV